MVVQKYPDCRPGGGLECQWAEKLGIALSTADLIGKSVQAYPAIGSNFDPPTPRS